MTNYFEIHKKLLICISIISISLLLLNVWSSGTYSYFHTSVTKIGTITNSIQSDLVDIKVGKIKYSGDCKANQTITIKNIFTSNIPIQIQNSAYELAPDEKVSKEFELSNKCNDFGTKVITITGFEGYFKYKVNSKVQEDKLKLAGGNDKTTGKSSKNKDNDNNENVLIQATESNETHDKEKSVIDNNKESNKQVNSNKDNSNETKKNTTSNETKKNDNNEIKSPEARSEDKQLIGNSSGNNSNKNENNIQNSELVEEYSTDTTESVEIKDTVEKHKLSDTENKEAPNVNNSSEADTEDNSDDIKKESTSPNSENDE